MLVTILAPEGSTEIQFYDWNHNYYERESFVHDEFRNIE